MATEPRGWWHRLRRALSADSADTPRLAAVQRQLAETQERHAQLQAALEHAGDAIITIDSRQRVQFVNRAACEMFGTSAPQALGEPLDRFIPTHRQVAHRLQVESFGRTGVTARRMGRLHELMGQRADGEVFPIEASISRSGEGATLWMTVVLRDVSAQRAAEATQAARLRAEAARRAMTEFVARLSHEMRAPLNAVLGFSQLLQTEAHEPLAPGQRQRVEQIRTAGWHLLRLLADTADLSVLESGSLHFDIRRIALLAVIDEALAICDTQARARGITVQVHDREALRATVVNGDPMRLRQVMINLLSNAVKYNRDGGMIDIHVRPGGALVNIEVIDTGIGMTDEQLAHLYEPFNRLGRERDVTEGTGIGLVLTRQLVERMNGRLAIDSEAGRGTRVRVTLPAADAGRGLADALLPPPPPAPPPGSDHEPLPGAVLLYIEDNAVNVLLVEQMLARWPQIGLVHAEDGHAGLELARRLRPDLVLVDLNLPDMSGLDVLTALQRDPATAALALVALSASAAPEDARQARAAGALEYWTKPLDVTSFCADVVRMLGRRPVAGP